MREVRLTVPQLIGDTWRTKGEIVPVEDHRARTLVELKHAELVAQIAVPIEMPPAKGIQDRRAPRAKALKA